MTPVQRYARTVRLGSIGRGVPTKIGVHKLHFTGEPQTKIPPSLPRFETIRNIFSGLRNIFWRDTLCGGSTNAECGIFRVLRGARIEGGWTEYPFIFYEYFGVRISAVHRALLRHLRRPEECAAVWNFLGRDERFTDSPIFSLKCRRPVRIYLNVFSPLKAFGPFLKRR